MNKENRLKHQIVKEYIGNHYDCTNTDIINYMRGHDRHGHPVKEKSSIHLSQKPTEKIIKDLTSGKNPIVVSLPDPKNIQTHRLHLNDKNLCNQVDQMLSKISKHITRWNEPIDKINKRSLKAIDLDKIPLVTYKENFIYSYYRSTGLMLRHILTLVKNMKFSEENTRTYMIKIMELTEEFNKQVRGRENIKEEAKNAMNELLETKNKLSDPKYLFLGQHYINSKMIDEVMQTLDSFNKLFLI